MCRVQNAGRITQNQNVISERDRAESKRDFGVVPQPPVRRTQRRECHRAEQQREWQDHPRIWRSHSRQLARAGESGSNRNGAFKRISEIENLKRKCGLLSRNSKRSLIPARRSLTPSWQRRAG